MKNIGAMVAIAAVAGVIGCTTMTPQQQGPLQRVKHVFVITLENKSYEVTFGTTTQAPYLNGTLKPMGALLTNYYATGHVSHDNYIAMLSGQPPSLDTQSDCQIYSDFKQTGTTGDGIAVGNGCVYPASVKTLPDQLRAKGLTWKGYMEDMGNDPTRESATCGHPALNMRDATQHAQAPSAAVPLGDQYATRHNPFVYFHSIIDSPDCVTNVVALNKLEADLASVRTTPNFVFITPNLCHDGHDGDGTGTPGKGCVNGEPGGLTSADKFLQSWVPKILASPAFKQDGLLIINFDESDFASMATSTDSATGKTTITLTFKGEACCAQQLGPNVSRPWTQVIPVSATLEYKIVVEGIGGDRTGAVLISPFIKPGTVANMPYNHYALLKTLEDIFQLGEYLGYANQPGLVPFGADIFNR
jgi:phosphatidylinositol-3-phosphatase